MNYRNSSFLCMALAFLALSSAIEAFDITKILSQYPDLSSFNQYLTQTKLADQINARQSVTILAVGNSAISAIAGKSPAAIKAILSNHVILGYYDEMKLTTAVENQQNQLTTLYQTTSSANSKLGFIKVGLIGEGEMAFGSAVNGAPINVELVSTVASQPNSVSILQIAKPIIAPGIEQSPPSSSPSASSPSSPKAKSPSPAPVTKSPPPPSSSSETPSSGSTPSSAPVTKAPSSSPSSEIPPPPESEMSPPPASEISPAPGPSDDDVPASGSSPQIQMGLVWAGVLGFGALLGAAM